MKAAKIIAISLVVVMFFMIGCASAPKQPAFQRVQPPAWYNEDVTEDANNVFFYSEGEGPIRTTAMQNASTRAMAQISDALGAIVLNHTQASLAAGGVGEDATVLLATKQAAETISRNMVRNARPRTDAVQIGEKHFIGFARYSFSKKSIFTGIADALENDPNLKANAAMVRDARALADSYGLPTN